MWIFVPSTLDHKSLTFDYCATARLLVYFSPMSDPRSAGIDAMMQSWDSLQAYALPPLQSSASYAVEGQGVQGSGAHLSGFVLASASLVSGPSGASGGCSGVPPTVEGST